MPKGTKAISAESCGISAWTKTAKVSVILPDGSPKRYFLKVIYLRSLSEFLFAEMLVPRSVRQGRAPALWPRANSTLRPLSTLWYQDLARNQLDGASIVMAN